MSFAETHIRHPIHVMFDSPEAVAAVATTETFSNPVVAFPPHVRVFNLGMILLGCAMLLIGAIFMPGSQYTSSWWHTSDQFSPASIIPTLLTHWQIAVGLIAPVIVPFLTTERRGRIALSLSLSLGVLLLISLLEQQTIGVTLVLMPLLGMVMMVLLNAVLRARTLAPETPCLKHWQLFAGLGTAALWALPAYESIYSFAMRNILMTVGGKGLVLAFSAASLTGLLAGLISAIDGGEAFSKVRNSTARLCSSAAIVVMGGCGLLMAISMGHVSGAYQGNARWYGVGMVWLDMLINGCLLMAWAGLVERFGLVAANRQDIPHHAAS
ncbi:MAG: hypothetical protein ACP5O1_01545 [Phycisphaerae bacterium]